MRNIYLKNNGVEKIKKSYVVKNILNKVTVKKYRQYFSQEI